ncbi:hypothetical protein BgiBS90_034623 [Biomphalaria glabrata]|nr:hypothetical protein BgiBS90_034623 [Biomphalaria glabrata]
MFPACANQPRSEPALSVGLVRTLVMPVTQLNVQPAGNTKDRGSPFILKWREASKSAARLYQNSKFKFRWSAPWQVKARLFDIALWLKSLFPLDPSSKLTYSSVSAFHCSLRNVLQHMIHKDPSP